MRFAEVFLRLGVSLVAWMILYAYLVWLAALHSIGCGPDGDDLHRLVLGLALLACGAAFLLRATRPFEDIHRILRWLGLPLALLLPFAGMSIYAVFVRANVNSLSICANNESAMWQQLWAPAQVITLAIIAYAVLQMLKGSAENNKEGN